MVPAIELEVADGLPNGHLEEQNTQQLANGDHPPAQAGKKLSASEKRRLRRKQNKKQAPFE